jgi:hypothetical protein
MEERREVYMFLVVKTEVKDHLGNPSLDGRITLRWIFRKWDARAGTESMRQWIVTGGGLL